MNRNIFDVCDYGARADDAAIDIAALQEAIDACGRAGGGRVRLAGGAYRSGTLRLRSGVELHVAKDARLVGLDDVEAYASFEAESSGKRRWHRGLTVGEGLRDIAVTGEGVIDGNRVFDPRGEEKMRGGGFSVNRVPYPMPTSTCKSTERAVGLTAPAAAGTD
jgi:polygalacturonase